MNDTTKHTIVGILVIAAVVISGIGGCYFGKQDTQTSTTDTNLQRQNDSLRQVVNTQQAEYSKLTARNDAKIAQDEHDNALIQKAIDANKQSIKSNNEKINRIPFNGLQRYLDSICHSAGFGQIK